MLSVASTSIKVVSCTKNCTVKGISYTVQDTKCKEDSENHRVPLPLFQVNYFLHGNEIEIHGGFKPSTGGSSQKYIRGFKLNVRKTNVLEDTNDYFYKYYCFNISDFQKHIPKIMFKLKGDIDPGDTHNVSVYTLPGKYECHKKRQHVNPKGWSKDCPKVVEIPSCGRELFYVHYCKMERKKKFTLNISHSKCQKYVSFSYQIPEELILESRLVLHSNPNSRNDTKLKEYLSSKINAISSSFKVPVKVFEDVGDYQFAIQAVNESYIETVHISECKNTFLALSICVLILVCLFAVFTVFFMFKRTKKKIVVQESFSKIVELPISKRSLNIYLGYGDTKPLFENVIFSFAHYLRKDLGVNVNFEPWSIEAQVSQSDWMEDMLKKCDKFVIVWSMDSIKTFQKQNLRSEYEGNLLYFDFVIQLKRGLLRNFIAQGKILSVYFDESCQDLIPEWFCKLVDKHFYLMNQFEEFFCYLNDQTKYYPHEKFQAKLSEPDEDFEKAITNLRGKHYKDENIKSDSEIDYLLPISLSYLDIKPPHETEESFVDLDITPPVFLSCEKSI